MTFEELALAPEILRAVRECGYTTPTPIQERVIPYCLAGRDLLGCAQTGTGKTAAFALPILHQIRNTPTRSLKALVLVPTRELAVQVGKNVREYGEGLKVHSTAVYGGVPIGPQEMMLRHGVDILIATPGRLKDLMWRGLIDFRDTRFLVLDEADRMLDMGFIDAVREIVALIPTERQTMLFSATLDPVIVRLARDILRDPVRVEVAPPATVADGIEHILISVEPGTKKTAMGNLIQDPAMHRTLVFTKTRRGAAALSVHLGRLGHRVSAIHSDKTQGQRLAALEAFRSGRVDFLVATDIAARGLDVDDISHVVNYDLPYRAEDYVHRIGRTARAGRKGVAISLVTPMDREVVHSIERLIGKNLVREVAMDSGRAAGRSAGGRSEAGRERDARSEGGRGRVERSGSGRSASRGSATDRGDNGRSETGRGETGRSESRRSSANRSGPPADSRTASRSAAATMTRTAPARALVHAPVTRGDGVVRRSRPTPSRGAAPSSSRSGRPDDGFDRGHRRSVRPEQSLQRGDVSRGGTRPPARMRDQGKPGLIQRLVERIGHSVGL
jgi:ATP-dependent RNA helicase RhlE